MIRRAAENVILANEDYVAGFNTRRMLSPELLVEGRSEAESKLKQVCKAMCG